MKCHLVWPHWEHESCGIRTHPRQLRHPDVYVCPAAVLQLTVLFSSWSEAYIIFQSGPYEKLQMHQATHCRHYCLYLQSVVEFRHKSYCRPKWTDPFWSGTGDHQSALSGAIYIKLVTGNDHIHLKKWNMIFFLLSSSNSKGQPFIQCKDLQNRRPSLIHNSHMNSNHGDSLAESNVEFLLSISEDVKIVLSGNQQQFHVSFTLNRCSSLGFVNERQFLCNGIQI